MAEHNLLSVPNVRLVLKANTLPRLAQPLKTLFVRCAQNVQKAPIKSPLARLPKTLSAKSALSAPKALSKLVIAPRLKTLCAKHVLNVPLGRTRLLPVQLHVTLNVRNALLPVVLATLSLSLVPPQRTVNAELVPNVDASNTWLRSAVPQKTLSANHALVVRRVLSVMLPVRRIPIQFAKLVLNASQAMFRRALAQNSEILNVHLRMVGIIDFYSRK